MNRKILVKILLVLVLAAAVILFWALGLSRYFSLEWVKESHHALVDLFRQHPAGVTAGYAGIYVVMAALSLPGAAVMSLAGAVVLGFWPALVAVSFASSLGATLACAASRFLLGDWVQRRFSGRLSAINRGVEQEGAFYLFTLRLVPVFPFFLINLAMGMTRMPLARFYWVSQLGMLPGTAVYVNAGTQLGRLDSAGGILSPALLASFALLGIFPLAAKKALDGFRKRTGRAAGAMDATVAPDDSSQPANTAREGRE
ncbi:MAG: TVP38/TMEM64 family protein [Pseudomonadota bacterium]